jgi:radical SAM protein with 4Fe4S-binding SPASM domain
MPELTRIEIKHLPLWGKLQEKRLPLSFEVEITARCNSNCCHCYINLPPDDRAARKRELSVVETAGLAAQAVQLGAVWCLITGGEPLLRPDFSELYLALKRAGLLVSVFTNATLLTEAHAALFREFPPRDIEVTVYGVTRDTYERVTRKPGSFDQFRRGLALLVQSGVRVRLKAMAIQSNFAEHAAIADFCRAHTQDYFRFDPQLHLRFDGDSDRNDEIRAERLTPEQIIALEQADEQRMRVLRNDCDTLIRHEACHPGCDHLFHCGAGRSSFTIGYDGRFRLCSSLWAPDTVYDLRQGSLSAAWHDFVPRVREMRSCKPELMKTCRPCPLVNLCLWCPAQAHLETGELDGFTPYFCSVAHARAHALRGSTTDDGHF